jgi:hypothetical protein
LYHRYEENDEEEIATETLIEPNFGAVSWKYDPSQLQEAPLL